MKLGLPGRLAIVLADTHILYLHTLIQFVTEDKKGAFFFLLRNEPLFTSTYNNKQDKTLCQAQFEFHLHLPSFIFYSFEFNLSSS